MASVISSQRTALQAMVEAVFDELVVVGVDDEGHDITAPRYTVATKVAFNPIDVERQLLLLDTNLPLLAVYLTPGKQTHRSGGVTAGGKATFETGWGVALVQDMAVAAQHGLIPNFAVTQDEVTDVMESVMLALQSRVKTEFNLGAGVELDYDPVPLLTKSGQPLYAFMVTFSATKEVSFVAD